jgi:hypothetical protein
VIKWFFGIRHTYNDNGILFDFLYTSHAIDGATKNGHLDVVQWFWDISRKHKQYPFRWNHHAVEKARQSDYLDVVKWFTDKKLIK